VRLDRTLHFDSAGQPNMPGKMIVRVQSAHGLLHLEKAKPPSPYFVLSLMSQVNVSAVSPETRNPLWDKEMVFDVPNQPSKLILSILDRTITGTDTIVILGKVRFSHCDFPLWYSWHPHSRFDHSGPFSVRFT
jgi:hypothetical protein